VFLVLKLSGCLKNRRILTTFFGAVVWCAPDKEAQLFPCLVYKTSEMIVFWIQISGYHQTVGKWIPMPVGLWDKPPYIAICTQLP
jgi:hypothetical protein